jgi:3-deoxy-7-phosphoheptulonate synthase
MRIPSPLEVKRTSLATQKQIELVHSARLEAIQILKREDHRHVCIVGPCSIHDRSAALEYGDRLRDLAQEVKDSLFLIMRVFCEKPRSHLGWKGWLTDPDLDGTNDLVKGIFSTRDLLLALIERGVPCAAEFLDPLASSYYQDLITWGFIGARTIASQPHRQLASSFDFPIGFKNGLSGELDPALKGILAARSPHCCLGIDEEGHAAIKWSSGNPFTHLVLRGSESRPNFDPLSIQTALKELKQHCLEPRFLIDCSHGNSGKDHRKQLEVIETILKNRPEGFFGFMIESHLCAGKQAHFESPDSLHYGLSITDSCIDWKETEEALRFVTANLN